MIFRFENKPPASPIHIIWGAIAIAAVAAAGIIKPFIKYLPVCAFHRVTGYPCPTCGATRSLVALSSFRFDESFNHNPLIMIGAIAMMVFSLCILLGIILQKKLNILLTPIEKKVIRYSIITTILANWAFLILHERI